MIYNFRCAVCVYDFACCFGVVFPVSEPTLKLLRFCYIFDFYIDRRAGIAYTMDTVSYTHLQILPSFWIAGGVRSISKDENDLPVLSMDNETFHNIVGKIFEMSWDSGTWYANKIDSDNDTTLENMFIRGNKMCIRDSLRIVMSIRTTRSASSKSA